jgi:hypothetical protein
MDESRPGGGVSSFQPPSGQPPQRSQGDGKISLDLGQKPFILNREFFFIMDLLPLLSESRHDL